MDRAWESRGFVSDLQMPVRLTVQNCVNPFVHPSYVLKEMDHQSKTPSCGLWEPSSGDRGTQTDPGLIDAGGSERDCTLNG